MEKTRGNTLAKRYAKGLARAAVLSACLGLPIAGCAGKNDASAANFERALNTLFQKAMDSGDCVGTKVTVMRREDMDEYFAFMGPKLGGLMHSAVAANKTRILSYATSGPFGQKKAPDPEQQRLFRALKDGGLVINDEIYAYTSPPPWRVSYATVALNENGMGYFTEQQVKVPHMGTETRHLICFGGARVDKILRWTEPAEKSGYKMTTVEFTVAVRNAPPWSKPVIDADDKLKKSLHLPLVLTNEGWSADMDSGR